MTSERERAITVGELIEILQGMDGTLPVGVKGHYGEFWAMTKYDVYHGAVDREASTGWRKHVEPFTICCFTPPSIGDEPD